MAPAPSDLGRRTASALVLAPLALAAIWLGGWPFYVLIAIITAGLTWEVLHLSRPAGEVGARRAPGEGAGLLLIWLAAAAFAWLRADPTAGRTNALFLLAIVWATDIAAYLIGRTAKGPRLAPSISPGKTWSGAVGGLVAAICAGLAAAAITRTSLTHAVVIATALSIIAQAGDLAESAIKRRRDVKDTSRLIPGHGGLLDRLDSTLAVSLAAALLVILRGRGVVLWG